LLSTVVVVAVMLSFLVLYFVSCRTSNAPVLYPCHLYNGESIFLTLPPNIFPIFKHSCEKIPSLKIFKTFFACPEARGRRIVQTKLVILLVVRLPSTMANRRGVPCRCSSNTPRRPMNLKLLASCAAILTLLGCCWTPLCYAYPLQQLPQRHRHHSVQRMNHLLLKIPGYGGSSSRPSNHCMTCTSFRQLLHPPPNLLQRSSSNLQATTKTTTQGDNNDDSDNESTQRKVAGRKKRVILGYRIVMIQFLVTTVLFVVSRGGVKQRPRTPAFVAYWTSGPLLVAGVSHILRGAAQHDRLSSDTYKRLNLFLAVYGMLSLSMALLAPETFHGPLFIVPPVFATVNAIKGYGYGVLGWDKKKKKSSSGRSLLQSDIWNGFQETVKNLFSLPKGSSTTENIVSISSLAKSIGYLAATWAVALLAVGKAWDIVQLAAGGGAAAGTAPTKILIASRCSRLARLTLLSSILYTLKDAADRNRLTGTTFIQLNALSSWAFATMAGTFSVQCCVVPIS
jgi:hypothetical protein